MADAWVGEWLQQFLKSPVWTTPIQSFIDENCDVFEDCDEEEHKLEFTKIHKEFCDIVEKVLSENLGDMGVSNEQFLEVVGKGSGSEELDTLVKEYLLSLDDFLTFRKMMEKRNIELELEVMVEYQDLADRAARGDQQAASNAEEAMMQLALKASVQDSEVRSKEVQLEDAQLQHALAISLAAEEERQTQREEEISAKVSDKAEQKAQIEDSRKESESRKDDIKTEILQARIEVAQKTPAVQEAQKAADCAGEKSETPPSSPPVPVAPCPSPVTPAAPSQPDEQKSPLLSKQPSTGSPQRSQAAQTATMDRVSIAPLVQKQPLPALGRKAPLPGLGLGPTANPTFQTLQQKVVQNEAPKSAPPPAADAGGGKAGPSQDEVARRMEMMKQQRDRLIAQKKQKREQELDEYIKEKTGKDKPAGGGGGGGGGDKAGQSGQSEEMRKALARRVKEDLLAGN